MFFGPGKPEPRKRDRRVGRFLRIQISLDLPERMDQEQDLPIAFRAVGWAVFGADDQPVRARMP